MARRTANPVTAEAVADATASEISQATDAQILQAGTRFQGRDLKVNESTPHPARNTGEKVRKRRDEMDFDDLPDE